MDSLIVMAPSETILFRLYAGMPVEDFVLDLSDTESKASSFDDHRDAPISAKHQVVSTADDEPDFLARTESPRRVVAGRLLGSTITPTARRVSPTRSQSTPRSPSRQRPTVSTNAPAQTRSPAAVSKASPRASLRGLKTSETPGKKAITKKIIMACPYIGLCYASMRSDRVANQDTPDMGGLMCVCACTCVMWY